MIRLIVNADDLGSGPGRDRGIFQAFREGIVTTASLLPNGPSFIAASGQARHLSLTVGVHLNLADGLSLTGAIGGITDAEGNFPGKTGLRRRLRAGAFDRAGVRRELAAQVERVLAAGLVPRHLDTHQHFLLFPSVTGCVLQVAREFGIRALRLPSPAEPAAADPVGELGEDLALYRNLAPAVENALRREGFASPEGLWGMPLLNRLSEATLIALLGRLPTGTWELMVHPGYRDPGDSFSGPQRETELAALTAPTIHEFIRVRGIHLITFGDLSCAS